MQVRYKLSYSKQDKHTKLTWQPGDVKNVTAQVAQILLRHPDVWEMVDVDALKGSVDNSKANVDADVDMSTQEEEIGLPEQPKATEEPLPVIDFHGMDKGALIEFAEKKYNERLDKRLAETTIRHKVIALFGKHQAELG